MDDRKALKHAFQKSVNYLLECKNSNNFTNQVKVWEKIKK